jgi:polysaccharide biosynthesis/export protein
VTTSFTPHFACPGSAALLARSFRLYFALLTALTTVGCAHRAVTRKQLPSAVEGHRQAEAPPPEDTEPPMDGQAYRIGPGDSLLVAVYGHPELALATYAGIAISMQGTRTPGYHVDNDGTAQFPLVGTVLVAGKTSAQLRQFLEQQLAVYIKDPKVTVQILFNGSLRYYMLGQFTNPGMKLSDRPMRLLEALSLAGSIDLPRASLRRAYVARAGRRLTVNFQRLVRDGDLRHNIRLRTGDIVFVPDNSVEVAFVYGGAPSTFARGGVVQFVNGQLGLMQALAAAGYGFRERTQGNLKKVVVMRHESDRGELFVVNAEMIFRGEAASFPLSPGDVVYVPPSGVAKWNLALEQLVPTLSAINQVINPFVQYKLLTGKNAIFDNDN